MTLRKALIVTGGAIAGLVVCVVLGVMVLLATGPGHAALRHYGLAALEGKVDGTVKIGSVGGSLWHAAEVRDIEFDDPAGRPVIRVAGLKVGYALASLLRGRIVLHGVELIRPTIVLEQLPDGTWNYQHLFRMLDTTRQAGAVRPLIDLRNARVVDGTIILKRRPKPDSVDTRRLTGVNLSLERLRVSHPDSTAIEATVAAFAARLDEPRLAISRGDGFLAVDGDSARIDMDHLLIGSGTRAAIAGKLDWGGLYPTGQLSINAQPIVFADLRGALPLLPERGGGRLAARLTLLADGTRIVDIRQAQLESGRSLAAGTARLVVGPRGGVVINASDVRLAPLDLATLQPYVDSLPVRGLVSGRIVARGAPADLAVDADLLLRDESANGAVSRVAARGRIGFGGPAGVRARGLVVARADFALATLSRLARGVPRDGHVLVSGTFDGPWRGPSVTALVLALEDGTAPSTVIRGRASFDSARVVDAEFTIDTLSFAQLAKLVPGFPTSGRAAGTLRARGPLDSLAFDLALRGPAGLATAAGVARLEDSLLAITAAGTLDSLDASRMVARAPPTLLTGRWSVALRSVPGDSSRVLTGRAQLALERILVSGLAFQRAGASLALEPGQVVIDSLWIQRPDLGVDVSGAIGLGDGNPRQLVFNLRADTVERLAPVIRWARALQAGDTTGQDTLSVPEGDLRAHGRIIGTTANFDLDGTLESARLRYDSAGLKNIQLVVEASPRLARPRFDLILKADSLWSGRLAYGDIDGAAAGTPDSFTARLAGRFGLGSEVRGAVRVARDSTRLTAHVDALALTVAGRRWRLDAPFSVRVSPDSLAVDSALLREADGPGRIWAAGSLPRGQPGAFALNADSVPLESVYAMLERDTAGVGGWTNAALRISGAAAAPVMDITLGLAEGRFGDYRAPLLRLAGRYENHRLTFKGGLWRDSVRVLDISAALPLDLAFTPVANRKIAGDYEVVARADSVDLALLSQVTSVVRDLRGRLLADVRVTGTWDTSPHVEGTVEVVSGALTLPALGERYSGIHARLGLADSVIRVERVRVVSGGTADVTGTVTISRNGPARLDLAIQSDHFNAMDIRRFGGVTASGDLTLRGPALGATLRGRMTADRGYLRFTDLVEKRIVNLDDPEFRAIVDSSLAGSRELAPSIVTVFLDSLRIQNLSVSMGNDVWLRSTEANIQLTGDFRVSKSVEDGLPRYRLDGTLNANRGTYRLNLADVVSKDFRVIRGEVRFFGTPDFNPELDIAAEHLVRTLDGGELMVRAIIGGTLLAPQLTLESDQRPPLTETEIVSYLMFGRPSFELAANTGPGGGERQLLGSAITSLAGVSAGLLEQSLVSQLGLPIDYLTIRPGAGASQTGLLAGARVEAGKQVSNRTFLTLNAGLCEVRQGQASSLLGASLEYRLSRRWTVEASYEPIVRQCRSDAQQQLVGTNYQFGFDLFWQSGIR